MDLTKIELKPEGPTAPLLPDTEPFNPTGKNPVNRKTYIRELSQLIKWDVDGTSGRTTPPPAGEVQMDRGKIAHCVKRFIKEAGVEEELLAKDSSKSTLYQVVARHITAVNIALMFGAITWEDYLKSTSEGVKESGSYLPPTFKGKGNPEYDDGMMIAALVRSMCVHIWNVRNSVDEVEMDGLGVLKLPPEASTTAINSLLSGSDLPPLEHLFEAISDMTDKIGKAKSEANEAEKERRKTQKEVDRLSKEVAELSTRMMAAPAVERKIKADGKAPDGELGSKSINDIFPDMGFDVDFEVPFWEWDGDHPDVPERDPHYIFRKDQLLKVLYAILTNQRAYLQGHTGSGKTTLVEQVAAHLNWPFIRINFDSEITRMDLIGRDTLHTDEEGNVSSKFVDGILPRAMSGPYIVCFDEIDFVRPDVGYVMQAALEGNGLRITEDGDRTVIPHPMFRMFGTGNTVGQGDEHGMYQGARPQSLAFLDRFTVWLKVDYLTPEERANLVDRHYPGLRKDDATALNKYMTEHLTAFETGKVIQPISPRGMLAIAKATCILGSLKTALQMTVVDRANEDDRATLLGIVNRVCK